MTRPHGHRKPPLADKRQAHQRGIMAESLVAQQLQKGGWQIIAQRLKTPHGEIDLIVRKPQRLLIVEVKYTQQADTSHLETRLPSRRQQQRIADASQYFLMQTPQYADHSLDFAVALVWKNGRIRYIHDWFATTTDA